MTQHRTNRFKFFYKKLKNRCDFARARQAKCEKQWTRPFPFLVLFFAFAHLLVLHYLFLVIVHSIDRNNRCAPRLERSTIFSPWSEETRHTSCSNLSKGAKDNISIHAIFFSQTKNMVFFWGFVKTKKIRSCCFEKEICRNSVWNKSCNKSNLCCETWRCFLDRRICRVDKKKLIIFIFQKKNKKNIIAKLLAEMAHLRTEPLAI